MTLIEFAQSIADYLCNKIPDVDEATITEIAELVTTKTFNYTQDELKKSNEEWQNRLEKQNDMYINWIKRM